MSHPEGLVSVRGIRHCFESDRFMDLKEIAQYCAVSARMLQRILPSRLRIRISSRKIVAKKSEIDLWLEQFRERPQQDIEEIARQAVEAVLAK